MFSSTNIFVFLLAKCKCVRKQSSQGKPRVSLKPTWAAVIILSLYIDSWDLTWSKWSEHVISEFTLTWITSLGKLKSGAFFTINSGFLSLKTGICPDGEMALSLCLYHILTAVSELTRYFKKTVAGVSCNHLYYKGCARKTCRCIKHFFIFYLLFFLKTTLLFSSAISRMHRVDLMRLANTAGLWPKVEKQCYLFCPFPAQGSYLLSQSHLMFVVSHIFQSLQRKHWWLLDQCTHLKTVQVRDNFQVSVLKELSQRIDLFQRNGRPDVSMLIPIVRYVVSQGR